MNTRTLLRTLALAACGLGLLAAGAHARDILPPPLTAQDLIHDRIDVHAQRSIVRLSNGDMDRRYAASLMFQAVRSGALGGIYIVDQGVPAIRARNLGTGWWTLLEGRPAMCWTEPAGDRPLIIMGKQAVTQAAVLDPALMAAFAECGFREIDVSVSRGGVPCVDAFVAVANEAAGIRSDPPCHVTENGHCHFALPPATYDATVTCDGQPTTPPVLPLEVTAGPDIQIHIFDF